MARKGRTKAREVVAIMQPTVEQMRVGTYEQAAIMHVDTARASRAYRLKPVIDTMLDTDQITQKEYDMLAYYAHQAALADKSPVRSCCDMTPRSTNGPGATILSAMLETGRIERDLDAHDLLDLTRAVVVANWTLTRWCIEQYGGRERYNGKGEFVAIVPVNEKRHVRAALGKLKYAAGVITR